MIENSTIKGAVALAVAFFLGFAGWRIVSFVQLTQNIAAAQLMASLEPVELPRVPDARIPFAHPQPADPVDDQEEQKIVLAGLLETTGEGATIDEAMKDLQAHVKELEHRCAIQKGSLLTQDGPTSNWMTPILKEPGRYHVNQTFTCQNVAKS